MISSERKRLTLAAAVVILAVDVVLIVTAPLTRLWGVGGVLAAVSVVFITLYAPLAILQPALLYRNGRWVRARAREYGSAPRVIGRKVLAVIVTNGRAASTVQTIIAQLRSYELPDVDILVLAEEGDQTQYSCSTVRVPAAYRTPKGSAHKLRALHHFSLWLSDRGYGPETYVVHLDDDSVVTRGYIEYVLQMREVSGQGNVRLREHGRHLMSTLADFVRIGDCDAWCDAFNRRGRPMAVHGEGLVIRADVEEELGWDFGTYGADDFIQGQRLCALGYTFACIPHEIYIAPPTTTRDFYVQRRRWLISILWARKEVRAIRPAAMRWILYRYAVGWCGFFGFGIAVYSLFFHLPIPTLIGALGLANFASYIGFYQYGAWKTDRRRYAWKMLLLQIPVAFYEGGTLFYSLLFPPDRRVFDVIRKV